MKNEKEVLRLVLVDPAASDESRFEAVLRRVGYDVVWSRAKTMEELEEAVVHDPDIVLAYSPHPAIDARRVLTQLRRLAVDVPVIALSDGPCEELGVESLRNLHSGALDCIRLEEPWQLASAVSRALRLRQLQLDKVRLESRLQDAQKTEALGLLAGGVAHDFNNILTVITGQCQLLLSHGELDCSERTRLEIIDRAADRGATLTRQLLAFSRRQMLDPVVVDLNGVLKDMSGMLARILGEDIVIDLELAPDLGRVRVDRGQIDQVVMNLAINARDAMPRGGKISLRTQNVEVGETSSEQRAVVSPGSYVRLTVEDRGEGMEGEVLERIFEPYFTTKDAGRGTGLGLATVYGIVSRNNGLVYVSSKPGEGSSFYVLLPRVDEPVVVDPEEGHTSSSLPGTILLVEDDDEVRNLLREILELSGYTVLESTGGREAMGRIEKEDGRVDLVVTDLVLPGMNGDELAHLLSARFPRIKVLYTSGHAERPLDLPLVDGYRELIQKPFRSFELARSVRRLLRPDARPEARDPSDLEDAP